MWADSSWCAGVFPVPPRLPGRAPAPNRGRTTSSPRRPIGAGCSSRLERASIWFACGTWPRSASALALLVRRVRADDHDPPVAPDDPALLADPLDARLDLHGVPFSFLRVAV